MPLKSTTLIICSDLDDLQQRRSKLVKKYEKSGQLLKWSDNAVETAQTLSIFKVIKLPTEVLDSLKGYNNVEPNYLLPQIYKFIKEIREILGLNDEEIAYTPPEATQAPENDEGMKMDSNTSEEQKNDKNEQ